MECKKIHFSENGVSLYHMATLYVNNRKVTLRIFMGVRSEAFP